MKILFVRSSTHIKNFNFILKCKKINFYIVHSIDAINKKYGATTYKTFTDNGGLDYLQGKSATKKPSSGAIYSNPGYGGNLGH